MDKEILNKIIAVFADIADMEEGELSYESSLMDDLGLNSMEIMSSIAAFEKKFSIRIPEKDIRFFVTIEDVAKYIADKL